MAAVDYKKELKELIELVVSEHASDIHFSVGSHPMIRVSGALIPLVKKPILTNTDVSGFVKAVLQESQLAAFLEKNGNGLFLPARKGCAVSW